MASTTIMTGLADMATLSSHWNPAEIFEASPREVTLDTMAPIGTTKLAMPDARSPTPMPTCSSESANVCPGLRSPMRPWNPVMVS